MQAMNSPGAPGTAEAPPGTEGLVHNKAVEPAQNLDLPISHAGIGCALVKLLPSVQLIQHLLPSCWPLLFPFQTEFF